MTEENMALDGVSGTFTSAYTYDLGGRLLTVTYPSGRVVTQSYIVSNGITNDLTDELEDATKGVSLLSAVQANAAGAITARTLSTGIAETRTFNQRNQLTRIAAAAGGATFMDMGYGYGTSSNTGKIRSRTDAVQPEHSASYTFDEIGRLTEVSGTAASWGISWTLDRYGNRTTQTPTGLASGLGSPNSFYGDPNTNRNAAFTYDNAGNLTDDGPNTYYYDAESRLYQINSSQVQYAYDYAGRRIKRTVGSETTYYFYGLTGLMSEFSTTSGAAGAAASDRLQYQVGEQTGTAVMLVDAGGTPRENNRVFPFGEPWLAFVGSNNTEKFTTYQRDDVNGEAGLDYAMARYYASRSGRFMTPDPGHIGANILDPQSWNAYVYSLNDPVNLNDPSGMLPCWVPFLGSCEDPGPPPDDPPCMTGFERSCPSVPGSDPVVGPEPPRIVTPPRISTVVNPQLEDPCEGPRKGLLSIVQWLQNKFQEILANQGELPMQPPSRPDPNWGTRSVTGEQRSYLQRQTHLQKQIRRFRNQGCGDPPPLVLEWVTKPVPSPAPGGVRNFNQFVNPGTLVKVGAGMGGGYLIYRAIRMVPSMYPPLWPTLPWNLATP